MEKKVIRVGSVGVGAIWGGVHEPGIAKSPDLTLVAICDFALFGIGVGNRYTGGGVKII